MLDCPYWPANALCGYRPVQKQSWLNSSRGYTDYPATERERYHVQHCQQPTDLRAYHKLWEGPGQLRTLLDMSANLQANRLLG